MAAHDGQLALQTNSAALRRRSPPAAVTLPWSSSRSLASPPMITASWFWVARPKHRCFATRSLPTTRLRDCGQSEQPLRVAVQDQLSLFGREFGIFDHPQRIGGVKQREV